MSVEFQSNQEEMIIGTNSEPLKAINVGIVDADGFIQEVVTLEELAMVGSSRELHMSNYGRFGEVEYAFTMLDTDNLSSKIAYLKERR
jgi:hypothetical protein